MQYVKEKFLNRIFLKEHKQHFHTLGVVGKVSFETYQESTVRMIWQNNEL